MKKATSVRSAVGFLLINGVLITTSLALPNRICSFLRRSY